jgi:hypothetical protein
MDNSSKDSEQDLLTLSSIKQYHISVVEKAHLLLIQSNALLEQANELTRESSRLSEEANELLKSISS